MTKRSDIDKGFLTRELAAELRLPLSVIQPIIDRIFLKILKHLMYGRSVRIPKFGYFYCTYRKPRLINGIFDSHITKPKIVPKLRFSDGAIALIENSQEERAERLAGAKKS